MAHLTPQVRADVNGKLVTRHVKTETMVSPAKGVPAPSLPAGKYSAQYDTDLMSLSDSLDDALFTGAYNHAELSARNVLHGNLLRMDPSVVAAFRKQIEDEPHVGYEDILVSVLHNNLNTKDASYILFMVQHQQQDGRSMDNYWDDGLEGTVEYDNATRYFKGIKQLAAQSMYRLPENIFEASEKARRQIGGVVRMLSTGYTLGLPGIVEMDWNTEAVHFTGYELAKLAMEYPDDAKRIIGIIKERGLEEDTGMDSIRMVLNAEVQPLSNGAL